MGEQVSPRRVGLHSNQGWIAAHALIERALMDSQWQCSAAAQATTRDQCPKSALDLLYVSRWLNPHSNCCCCICALASAPPECVSVYWSHMSAGRLGTLVGSVTLPLLCPRLLLWSMSCQLTRTLHVSKPGKEAMQSLESRDECMLVSASETENLRKALGTHPVLL